MSAVNSTSGPLTTNPHRRLPSRRLRTRRVLKGLASVGPFALTLTTYGLLVDHVPQSLFTKSWPDFIFCGTISLCVGLATLLAGQWALGRYQPQSVQVADTVENIGPTTTRR